MAQLFLDMDGVLADFDAGFETLFGYLPNSGIDKDSSVWSRVHDHGSFWTDLKPLPDAYTLWDFALPYRPIILTALPRTHTSDVAAQKTGWAKTHFKTSRVICVTHGAKAAHASPGDILVDDRPKYQKSWTDAGGVWITHTSAASSITQLKQLGLK